MWCAWCPHINFDIINKNLQYILLFSHLRSIDKNAQTLTLFQKKKFEFKFFFFFCNFCPLDWVVPFVCKYDMTFFYWICVQRKILQCRICSNSHLITIYMNIYSQTFIIQNTAYCGSDILWHMRTNNFFHNSVFNHSRYWIYIVGRINLLTSNFICNKMKFSEKKVPW